MAKPRKRVPRNRWRLKSLAADRGRHKIKRKNKQYSSGRFGEHVPKINPQYKLRGKVRGNQRITLPKDMSLSTDANRDLVFSLILDIRDASLKKNYKRVVLDHSKVESMSPEVALIMLAEIQRCRRYCKGRTLLTGTYPNNHSVSELLIETGFYEALGVKAPELPTSYKRRTYVRVERHNKTLSAVVDDLLDCFSEEFDFETADRRRLQVALIECMDNVFEHAYHSSANNPYLYREWWMIGYSDHQDGSISFTFYDQGQGIASTLREKMDKRIVHRLRGWNDANWLERAIRKPISRHESARRGHGLNKLKMFIDRIGHQGSLRVLANTGDVQFTGKGVTSVKVGAQELSGSLIVWTLCPSNRLPVVEHEQ